MKTVKELQGILANYTARVKEPFSQVPKENHSIFKGLSGAEKETMQQLIKRESVERELDNLGKAFDNLPPSLRGSLGDTMDRLEDEYNSLTEELGIKEDIPDRAFDHMIEKEMDLNIDNETLIDNINQATDIFLSEDDLKELLEIGELELPSGEDYMNFMEVNEDGTFTIYNANTDYEGTTCNVLAPSYGDEECGEIIKDLKEKLTQEDLNELFFDDSSHYGNIVESDYHTLNLEVVAGELYKPDILTEKELEIYEEIEAYEYCENDEPTLFDKKDLAKKKAEISNKLFNSPEFKKSLGDNLDSLYDEVKKKNNINGFVADGHNTGYDDWTRDGFNENVFLDKLSITKSYYGDDIGVNIGQPNSTEKERYEDEYYQSYTVSSTKIDKTGSILEEDSLGGIIGEDAYPNSKELINNYH